MINGPSLVIAGPGTGKTTFLVKECLEIIKSEHFKGIILCTFTNKSANELKKRLENQISIKKYAIIIAFLICIILFQFVFNNLSNKKTVLDFMNYNDQLINILNNTNMDNNAHEMDSYEEK